MKPRLAIRTALSVALSVILPAAVLFSAPPAHAAVPVNAFTIDSEPGDYLGDGQTLTFTSSNATISESGSNTDLQMSATAVNTLPFMAFVGAPTGQTLTAGTTYPTMRFADASNARLDIDGDGRGCNTSKGTLHVLEVVVDGSNNITSFAATYIQHCEGLAPAFYGELRYNSSVHFKADSVSPTWIDFGNQGFTPSSPHMVTIANTGDQSLSLGAATLSGPQSADYSLSSDTCSSSSLTVGSSCAIGVVFTPGDFGTRTAALTLSATTARGTIAISFTGIGVMLRTSVTLISSASSVALNGPVTITAHLTDYNTTIIKHLDIYATPYGGSETLIQSGDVDTAGNLSIQLPLDKKTSFVAQFPGDATYDPATSVTVTVSVYPIVKGKFVSFYATSGHYRLYHYFAACSRSGRRCPTYDVSVSPNHARLLVNVTVDAWVHGAWRAVLGHNFALNRSSKQKIIFVYGNSHVINVRFRARVLFGGDADHLAQASGWSYFRVTT